MKNDESIHYVVCSSSFYFTMFGGYGLAFCYRTGAQTESLSHLHCRICSACGSPAQGHTKPPAASSWSQGLAEFWKRNCKNKILLTIYKYTWIHDKLINSVKPFFFLIFAGYIGV